MRARETMPIFIGGATTCAANRNPFEYVTGATGGIVAKVERACDEAGHEDFDEAAITVDERAAMLNRAAGASQRSFNAFLWGEARETDKPVSLTSHVDIPRGAEAARRPPRVLAAALPPRLFVQFAIQRQGRVDFRVGG